MRKTLLMTAYRFFWWFFLPLALIRLWWRGRIIPGYRWEWVERFGLVGANKEVDIWWHAVSVGEILASAPILVRLQKLHPELTIWVTMSTPTGRERLHRLLPQHIDYSYAPYDHQLCVKAFLSRVKPKLLVVIETEVWPEWMHQVSGAGIPSLLVNGRLSAKSLVGYLKFKPLIAPAFQAYSRICAQGAADAKRYLQLGVNDKQLSVTGNVKFDISVPTHVTEQGLEFRQSFEGRPVWVAASTHAGEEAIVLQAHREILKDHPTALLILVPRHPDRFAAVAYLLEEADTVFVRRSTGQTVTEETAVYLVDTMGEMLLMMIASQAAFVGGSLVRHGGHNLLEPIACGVPLLTGPHVFNFQTIFGLLDNADAVLKVSDESSLAKKVKLIFNNEEMKVGLVERGQKVLRENQGACNTVTGVIERKLRLKETTTRTDELK